ncbi:unnamed protein product [Ostreobium quekettii]|uniref:tRNA-splicing endonuclease subunit Sen54 N-terminal domain-containing protein n=1 Tax=Ostreobium quekettii TaxID=121088 RepID=A0A8S1J505_9CHLO|nr:unnamed protein product [Ostreobium quekettii]
MTRLGTRRLPTKCPRSREERSVRLDNNEAEYLSNVLGRRDMSTAVARPSTGTAEVTRQRGALLNCMGFNQNRKLNLHMEEAV